MFSIIATEFCLYRGKGLLSSDGRELRTYGSLAIEAGKQISAKVPDLPYDSWPNPVNIAAEVASLNLYRL
jgi:hypothetical protein